MSSLPDRRDSPRRRVSGRSFKFLQGWISGAVSMLGMICALRWLLQNEDTGWSALFFGAAALSVFLYAENIIGTDKTDETGGF